MSTTFKVPPAIPADRSIEAQVEAKLRELTLEEKVGQMCEITVDPLTDWNVKDRFALNDAVVDKVIRKYKVGSILNVPFSECQSQDVWVELIRKLNQVSIESCRGVTQVYGVDQIHGTTYTLGGTLFPQEISQAASFNRDIARRVAEISAYESRACLIPWVYAPVLDIARNQMWSRMWESFGEDTLVNAEMGAAATLGYQGNDPNHVDGNHVAACMKHYMAYGAPGNGKDRTPSVITDREMREKFFEPFRRCAEAGCLSVMITSSVNNAMPFHCNAQMVKGWLKDELNWDGMVVSDWADVRNVFDRDHVAESYKEAIELCVNAGVDMTMEPHDVGFCDLLLELVKEGRVSMERVDDACRRVLRMKYRLGLMDRKTWDMPLAEVKAKYPKFGSNEFGDEAVKMAEECMVLLKNSVVGGQPLLPLKPNSRILVCGPNADTFRGMNGGWTCSWQGHITDEVCRMLNKHQYKTFYGGIRDKFGAGNVKLVEGVSYAKAPRPDKPAPGSLSPWQASTQELAWHLETPLDLDAVLKASADADVIIACVGENSYTETPGNINDLALSPQQTTLVGALTETGKPVVLVLNGGRPRLIRDIEPLVAATINTSLPGTYGGAALANLLSGDANFSGRLPFTYPKHPGALETYDYKPCQNRAVMEGNYNYDAIMDVLYPFGSGLSYTTFQYSNLSVDRKSFRSEDTLVFTVDVKNTGSRAGKEAVLLFVSDVAASVSPDVRRLRAFTKISLNPGEKKTVRLEIKGLDLAFVGYDNHWRVEKGEFVATCGGEHVKFECAETRYWDTPNRVTTFHPVSKRATRPTPDDVFGDLFVDVQMKRIFPDNKTFVDCQPKFPPNKINADYAAEKGKPGFSLEGFVKKNFEMPPASDDTYRSDTNRPIADHIAALWEVLKREPTHDVEGSSLLPVPNPFIVPGDRFRETYYWDSYFTMLGLQVSGQFEVLENMVKNFDYTIKTYGHIPNGMRSYYLGRSQPPYYAMMVDLVAERKGRGVYKEYLTSLQIEHDYFMDLTAAPTQHVVRLDDAVLNRYWDQLDKPRQESYYEDVTLAQGRPDAKRMYRDLRSGAESGWDFTSRWFKDPLDISTIRTTDILPVDLNCLLYHLEKTLGVAYDESGDRLQSEAYKAKAAARAAAIQKYFYNPEDGWYYDYVISERRRSTLKSAAGAHPFFVNVAPKEQAARAAERIEKDLLKDGGVVCTLVHNGQQWDAPNGWAPLQWAVVKGMENYGQKELAKKISLRWISMVTKVYKATGKLMEKYNVEDLTLIAGGGEYPAQDGFGWTNGVLLRMMKDYQ